ncbi:uro-adherence factor A-like [Hyperolius riggenbachi]|uniref:uro-adherence factor A-like n=1 Tax=Hyperolius riggenbachi TaxID=752182 RepID=UPI0035A32CE3
MEFLHRHFPRVAQAVRNALVFITNVTAQVFGAPPDAPQPRHATPHVPIQTTAKTEDPTTQEETCSEQARDLLNSCSECTEAIELDEESPAAPSGNEDNQTQDTDLRPQKSNLELRWDSENKEIDKKLSEIHTTAEIQITAYSYKIQATDIHQSTESKDTEIIFHNVEGFIRQEQDIPPGPLQEKNKKQESFMVQEAKAMQTGGAEIFKNEISNNETSMSSDYEDQRDKQATEEPISESQLDKSCILKKECIQPRVELVNLTGEDRLDDEREIRSLVVESGEFNIQVDQESHIQVESIALGTMQDDGENFLDVTEVHKKQVTPVSEVDNPPCYQGKDTQNTLEALLETAVRLAKHCDSVQKFEQEPESFGGLREESNNFIMEEKRNVEGGQDQTEIGTSEEAEVTGLVPKADGKTQSSTSESRHEVSKTKKSKRRVHFSPSTEDFFQKKERVSKSILDLICDDDILEGQLQPTIDDFEALSSSDFKESDQYPNKEREGNYLEDDARFCQDGGQASTTTELTVKERECSDAGWAVWYDDCPIQNIGSDESFKSFGNQNVCANFKMEESVTAVSDSKSTEHHSDNVPSSKEMVSEETNAGLLKEIENESQTSERAESHLKNDSVIVTDQVEDTATKDDLLLQEQKRIDQDSIEDDEPLKSLGNMSYQVECLKGSIASVTGVQATEEHSDYLPSSKEDDFDLTAKIVVTSEIVNQQTEISAEYELQNFHGVMSNLENEFLMVSNQTEDTRNKDESVLEEAKSKADDNDETCEFLENMVYQKEFVDFKTEESVTSVTEGLSTGDLSDYSFSRKEIIFCEPEFLENVVEPINETASLQPTELFTEHDLLNSNEAVRRSETEPMIASEKPEGAGSNNEIDFQEARNKTEDFLVEGIVLPEYNTSIDEDKECNSQCSDTLVTVAGNLPLHDQLEEDLLEQCDSRDSNKENHEELYEKEQAASLDDNCTPVLEEFEIFTSQVEENHGHSTEKQHDDYTYEGLLSKTSEQGKSITDKSDHMEAELVAEDEFGAKYEDSQTDMGEDDYIREGLLSKTSEPGKSITDKSDHMEAELVAEDEFGAKYEDSQTDMGEDDYTCEGLLSKNSEPGKSITDKSDHMEAELVAEDEFGAKYEDSQTDMGEEHAEESNNAANISHLEQDHSEFHEDEEYHEEQDQLIYEDSEKEEQEITQQNDMYQTSGDMENYGLGNDLEEPAVVSEFASDIESGNIVHTDVLQIATDASEGNITPERTFSDNMSQLSSTLDTMQESPLREITTEEKQADNLYLEQEFHGQYYSAEDNDENKESKVMSYFSLHEDATDIVSVAEHTVEVELTSSKDDFCFKDSKADLKNKDDTGKVLGEVISFDTDDIVNLLHERERLSSVQLEEDKKPGQTGSGVPDEEYLEESCGKETVLTLDDICASIVEDVLKEGMSSEESYENFAEITFNKHDEFHNKMSTCSFEEQQEDTAEKQNDECRHVSTQLQITESQEEEIFRTDHSVVDLIAEQRFVAEEQFTVENKVSPLTDTSEDHAGEGMHDSTNYEFDMFTEGTEEFKPHFEQRYSEIQKEMNEDQDTLTSKHTENEEQVTYQQIGTCQSRSDDKGSDDYLLQQTNIVELGIVSMIASATREDSDVLECSRGDSQPDETPKTQEKELDLLSEIQSIISSSTLDQSVSELPVEQDHSPDSQYTSKQEHSVLDIASSTGKELDKEMDGKLISPQLTTLHLENILEMASVSNYEVEHISETQEFELLGEIHSLLSPGYNEHKFPEIIEHLDLDVKSTVNLEDQSQQLNLEQTEEFEKPSVTESRLEGSFENKDMNLGSTSDTGYEASHDLFPEIHSETTTDHALNTTTFMSSATSAKLHRKSSVHRRQEHPATLEMEPAEPLPPPVVSLQSEEVPLFPGEMPVLQVSLPNSAPPTFSSPPAQEEASEEKPPSEELLAEIHPEVDHVSNTTTILRRKSSIRRRQGRPSTLEMEPAEPLPPSVASLESVGVPLSPGKMPALHVSLPNVASPIASSHPAQEEASEEKPAPIEEFLSEIHSEADHVLDTTTFMSSATSPQLQRKSSVRLHQGHPATLEMEPAEPLPPPVVSLQSEEVPLFPGEMPVLHVSLPNSAPPTISSPPAQEEVSEEKPSSEELLSEIHPEADHVSNTTTILHRKSSIRRRQGRPSTLDLEPAEPIPPPVASLESVGVPLSPGETPAFHLSLPNAASPTASSHPAQEEASEEKPPSEEFLSENYSEADHELNTTTFMSSATSPTLRRKSSVRRRQGRPATLELEPAESLPPPVASLQSEVPLFPGEMPVLHVSLPNAAPPTASSPSAQEETSEEKPTSEELLSKIHTEADHVLHAITLVSSATLVDTHENERRITAEQDSQHILNHSKEGKDENVNLEQIIVEEQMVSEQYATSTEDVASTEEPNQEFGRKVNQYVLTETVTIKTGVEEADLCVISSSTKTEISVISELFGTEDKDESVVKSHIEADHIQEEVDRIHKVQSSNKEEVITVKLEGVEQENTDPSGKKENIPIIQTSYHEDINQGQVRPLVAEVGMTDEPVVQEEADLDNNMLPHSTLDVSAQKSRIELRRKISVRRRQGRPTTVEIEQAEPPPPPVAKPRSVAVPIFPGKMPVLPVFLPTATPPPASSHPAQEEASEEKPASEELAIKPKKGFMKHAGFGIPHPQMMQELQARLHKKKPKE